MKHVFTIGHDVIAQTDVTNPLAQVVHTLLSDGHGSTRALLSALSAIVQQYAYDAYGNMLAGTGLATAATALTNLLYSGEWTMKSGQQYLRARIYDPANGTFNRLDPFAGNLSDPQSLHKYLYTHANPVMGVDPSGELFASVVRIGTFIRNNLVRVGRFFYDARKFDTIRRSYWRGRSAGDSSLHHWLIPQRFTRVPQGIRNAGFNLVVLPGLRGTFHRSLTLNSWMGFAVRWGGTHATRASVVEWGIRFAIPVSIGGGVYLGTVIDDLIPD